MVVLCPNNECAAVLRVDAEDTLVTVRLRGTGEHAYFECPRCGQVGSAAYDHGPVERRTDDDART